MLLGSFTPWQGLLEVMSTWKLWICTSYWKAWFSKYTFIEHRICKPVQNAHISGLCINSEYLLHHVKWNFLESMLFKQPLIWKNVLESGSYSYFSSSQKGCWGGIRNLNRNSCKIVKVSSRQQFSSVAGAACALSQCSSVLPGSCRNPMQDSDGGLVLWGGTAYFTG